MNMNEEEEATHSYQKNKLTMAEEEKGLILSGIRKREEKAYQKDIRSHP